MILWTITKSIGKQLIVMAIIIVISLALMSVNQALGIIVMMLLSSFMVIKSSNKEMPLNKFTALLPGLMSLLIFLIMLALLDVENEIMPLIGIGLGLIFGGLMARGHDVYVKNGILYAKRTFFYVFIWTISILFTQGSTLLGMRNVTDFGLLLNGFSTSMMVILSMILFFRTFNKKVFINNTTHGSLLVLLTIVVLSIPQTSNARTIHCAPNNEICCFAHAFGTGGPVKFEVCMAQGMSFEVDNLPSSSNDSFSFPNDETAAGGIILALLMLLTSLGINTSMLVAQGAATAAMSASQTSVNSTNPIPNVQDTTSTSTEDKYGNDNILDGKNATNWMKDHGYLDKETGLPTQKFTDFMNSMPSESGTELQGFAGDLDKNGNPVAMLDEDGNPKRDEKGNIIYDFAIVRDGTPAQQETYQKDNNLKKEKSDLKPSTNNHDTGDSDSNKKNDNLKTEKSDIDSSLVKTSTSSNHEDKDKNSDSSSSDSDKKTTTTSNGTEQKTSKDEPPAIDYTKVEEKLEKIMDEIVKDKTSEKYFVRNPGFTKKAWNNTLGWVLNEKYGDYKGGQCGDYAEWGAKWSREKIEKLFGKDVYVTKILVENTTYSGSNHAATRVVLANGDKYVLDFWEGIENKKSSVYKEADWIKKQKNDFYFDIKVDYTPDETFDQDMLKEFIDKHGEKEGKVKYFNYQLNPTKAKTTIEAWEADPW